MGHQLRSMFSQELKQEAHISPIIIKEELFSLDYIPIHLKYRETQLKEMIHHFKGLFRSRESWTSYSQTIILTGEVGTGKTVTAKRFGIEIERLAQEKLPWITFVYRHLNCRRNRTVFSVLIALMKTMIPEFPSRGFASAELIRMLQTLLDQTNTYLLLTLDEIDFLTNDPEFNNFLYSLTRLNDEHLQQSYRRISLILITRDPHFFSRLDGSTQSSLSKNIIIFPVYSEPEIQSILHDRATESLNENSMNKEVLREITSVVRLSGDARFALELLWRAAKKAENSNSSKILQEHVLSSIATVYPVKSSVITDLSLPQKVLLLSITHLIKKKTHQKFTILSEIKDQFLIERGAYNLKIGKGNTSIWNHLQVLKELQLIYTEIISRNYRGRFTKITLEVPVDIVLQEIVPFLKGYISKQK